MTRPLQQYTAAMYWIYLSYKSSYITDTPDTKFLKATLSRRLYSSNVFGVVAGPVAGIEFAHKIPPCGNKGTTKIS